MYKLLFCFCFLLNNNIQAQVGKYQAYEMMIGEEDMPSGKISTIKKFQKCSTSIIINELIVTLNSGKIINNIKIYDINTDYTTDKIKAYDCILDNKMKCIFLISVVDNSRALFFLRFPEVKNKVKYMVLKTRY